MITNEVKVKSVLVRAYERFRFGKLESVSEHMRSRPMQLHLFD